MRGFLVLMAAAALTACSLDGFGGTDNANTPARQEARPQATAPAPAARARPRADLEDILGAESVRVDGYLGRPRIVRREGAGELRLYRSSACVVHVFMYPRAGRLTAAHVEARAENRRLSGNRADACIGSFS